MNPADHYDPLMDLNHFTDKLPMTGSPATPKDGGVGVPAGVYHFDPTANMRTPTTNRVPLAVQPPVKDTGLSLPAGVDNYDPLNLPTPPRHGPLVSPASNPTKGSAGRP